ncbi:amino acid-binding ACT domain protein [Magnetococcus marinus MC-1]|uniref:Amino acid-binding ACT domain protein n=1 Tax=Magnetococcus marinus (strain ATCC BAA-1437 / JCM 17883 / MC-1) TaxID=156889 RepID=A0LDD8_MAGMM|nr:ACT domain-containing protein [Magnetococcus marinus]ABK45981.1 amino acid-binding ACT domain protein [Magnetococcus marinus MC-1]
MANYVLLQLSGLDRPGIVAEVTRVLFETGCNIEDSSMTRLSGQFTIMLVLSPPHAQICAELEAKLKPVVARFALAHLITELSAAQVEDTQPADEEESFLINVLGADKPGIVYHVTQLLADKAVNIVDMHTHTGGAVGRPIYIINIEVEGVKQPEALRTALKELAAQLQVEISLRAGDVFEL